MLFIGNICCWPSSPDVGCPTNQRMLQCGSLSKEASHIDRLKRIHLMGTGFTEDIRLHSEADYSEMHAQNRRSPSDSLLP